MKPKSLFSVVVVLVLALSMMMPVLTASAALPANLSWVKYSGNPVIPSGACGGAPARPMVLLESTNNYTMYYTDFSALSTVARATTSDGGQTWTCTGTVLAPGSSGTWDDARAINATVLKEGATDYKMWYTGRNAAGVYGIGYATSTDGITWLKYGSNPVLTVGAPASWESQYVRAPSVVKVGSTYHMFYEGTAQWPYFKIGHATSSDGILWVKDASNPVLGPTPSMWDAIETYAPSVVMNDSVFEMFYSGNNGGKWMVGHASSNNGTIWTKDSNAIISPSATGWDSADSTDYASAVRDGATWKLFYSGAGMGGYQIGLATLTNQAQLSFNQLAVSIATGGTVTVDINVANVANLYGYQFEVNYPPAVTASATFVNTFLDTTTNASIPSTWNASCASGVCRFAVSKIALPGVTPVSGSGTLARITFSNGTPTEGRLTFSNDILSALGAAQIAHTTMSGYLTVYGSATINGTLALQGRPTPIDAGTVTLYDAYGYMPPTTVSFDQSTGAFSALVSVQPGGTTYQLVAAHSLYLNNRRGDPVNHTGLAVTAGGVYNAGTTTLKGGDANNDGTIGIGDMTIIGSDFGNGGTGPAITNPNADITKDGSVNILDLVLAGGNYGLSAPQPW